jgi:hypothetical protein
LIVALSSVSLGSCSIFDEHEEICRREARVIIHDQERWQEYKKEAEQTYRSRAERFPNTGRTVAEYAAGFEIRFGSELKHDRNSENGSVIRDDLYILQNGNIVVQYVDFVARRDGLAAPLTQSCIGNFPELYSDTVPVDQR